MDICEVKYLSCKLLIDLARSTAVLARQFFDANKVKAL